MISSYSSQCNVLRNFFIIRTYYRNESGLSYYSCCARKDAFWKSKAGKKKICCDFKGKITLIKQSHTILCLFNTIDSSQIILAIYICSRNWKLPREWTYLRAGPSRSQPPTLLWRFELCCEIQPLVGLALRGKRYDFFKANESDYSLHFVPFLNSHSVISPSIFI